MKISFKIPGLKKSVPPPAATLEVLDGPMQGEIIVLRAPETRAGRGEDNEIGLFDYAQVSRNHARFHFDDGAWQLEDLGSTNGTFINGECVSFGPLSDGAIIKLGDFSARVSIAQNATG